MVSTPFVGGERLKPAILSQFRAIGHEGSERACAGSTVPIPISDDAERGTMGTGPRSDRVGHRGVETDIGPTVASTTEAMERQLTDALDAAESAETRFHLRQALQLVKALDG